MKVDSQYEESIYCSIHGETMESGEEYFLVDKRYFCEECADILKLDIQLLQKFSMDLNWNVDRVSRYDLKQIAGAIHNLLNMDDEE